MKFINCNKKNYFSFDQKITIQSNFAMMELKIFLKESIMLFSFKNFHSMYFILPNVSFSILLIILFSNWVKIKKMSQRRELFLLKIYVVTILLKWNCRSASSFGLEKYRIVFEFMCQTEPAGELNQKRLRKVKIIKEYL